MRRTLSATLVILTSTAAADTVHPLQPPRQANHYDFVAAAPDARGIQLARRLLPANGQTAVLAQSRVIYLNHTGVTLRPGDDDSRANTSSIVGGQVHVPAWTTSAQHWADTVTCFKDMWKEFDVVITDQDPGAVPHMEAVFGGSPGNVGMPSGVGGVSPFTDDCGIIENSIVFTFTDVFPDDPQLICEVMSQEVAHSYGLDHEMLASDPMTYLNYNGNKTFKDQLVSCGEYSNRACGIGGSVCRNQQNSVALLRERTGTADLVPPTLSITSPADAATVPPGFEVTATAADDKQVTLATLYIDDVAVSMTDGAGPYTFATDAALAEGAHAIRVEVTDGHNTQSQAIAVTIRVGTPPDGTGGGDDASATTEDVSGGCSTSKTGGFAIVLALGALLRRRRR